MESTDVSTLENVSDDDQLEGSQVQKVIGLLLTKPDHDGTETLQVDFPVDSKSEASIVTSSSTVTAISLAATSSPLNISQVTLTDASMLLEPADIIQHSLDGNSATVQLDDGTTTFVQDVRSAEESNSCDVTAKFTDGQIVKLENGEMAFLHMSPQEGYQQVQLSDGTIAYLSQVSTNLFDSETSDLGLEQLSSQIAVENDEKDEIKVAVTENNRVTNSKSSATGERAFHCPYEGCNRLYTTQHHLKVHERSHTGDRPFKCTFMNCEKAFATGYGLKSHTRVHTGETPYRCIHDACTKAFKTSGDLQKHVRTHTGERPFKCPYEGCDRAFTTSNIRKVHIRIHTGERPYACKIAGCGRAFSSATNFKNHIRIHTGEKPYICPVQGCNKRFTEYSSLYKHNVVHTHSKPYVCNLCGKNYRQTSTLAMHRRTVHGIIEATEEAAGNGNETSDLRVKAETTTEDKSTSTKFTTTLDISKVATLLTNSSNSEQGKDDSNKKLPTIVALQGDDSTELLQQRPLYAVQLQEDGTISSAQQILVVTDPAQLAALQQFAQQAQLQGILTQTESPSAAE